LAIPAEQAETAALLRRLAGREPLETHISAIFLGTDTVWKLRKAVRLSFLDFSTVTERRRCALREIELNAPFAPGLYRDVVPIVRRADGSLAFGAGDAATGGEAIEWVVRMARVPEADFLEAVAASGGLTPALLDEIADQVASYHRDLPASAKDQSEALRHIVLGNVTSALAAGLPRGVVHAWRDGALAALSGIADWLRARGRAGFVRRCHGDLQLGNWCLWRGRPVPFDALDFDEDLATTDVAYDLAFLLMDLEERGTTPEWGGLPLTGS
jgi:aminoglycoside phosphotransferase family enzyme